MKLKLKYPTLLETQENQALFHLNSPAPTSTNQENSNTEEATILGSLATVFYFLIFCCAYGSTYYKGKFLVNNYDYHSSFSLSDCSSVFECKPHNILGSNKTNLDVTMSQAFKGCEKTLVTLMIVIFFGLFLGLYTVQNFTLDNMKTIPVLVLDFILLACWILLYFVTTDKKIAHHIIAFIISICMLSNVILVYMLYNEYYQSEDLDILNFPSYFVFGLYALLIIFFMFSFFLWDKFPKFFYIAVPIVEILAILSFTVFLGVFSQLPPIPSDSNIACSYVPTPVTQSPTNAPK